MNRIFSGLLENWPITAIGLGLLTVAILFYGCESRPIAPPPQSEDAASSCGTLLASGIDRVRPENFGVVGASVLLRGRIDEAADKLTNWLRREDCQAAVPTTPLSDEARALMTRLLGPEATAELTDEQLDAFNAADLRSALLNFETAESLSAGAENDVRRVERLFNYVVRVISPEAESSVELLLSDYEAELFGRGSAEARTWLFANLLRQLRIDAVVLRPGGTESSDAETPWWIGVPIRGEVYVFDSRLGLPVPSPEAEFTGESITPPPATWREIVESPELLTEYRVKAGLEAQPIDAQRLKTPRVELIGPSTYWAKPIERIELSLQKERGVLLYDPLQDTPAGPGLYHRIVEAGAGLWTEEAIGVWPYPGEYRRTRAPLLEAETASSSEQRRLDQRLAPLLGPVRVEIVQGAPRIQQPSKDLWLTRVGQMSGTGGGVIGRLLGIVGEAVTPHPALPPRAESLNRQAADEAFYWSGHAQYRVGAWDTAIRHIGNYIESNGDRSDEAAALRVLGLAEQGEWEAAIKAANELPETVPGRERFVYLAKWWK